MNNQVVDTNKQDKDSFYTNEEKELLELTKKVRVDAIKEMTKNGPNKETSINRVINEIASSIDSSIQKNAENRLKLQDTQNKEDLLNTVAEVIRANKRAKNETIRSEEIPNLPENYIPDNIVEGELEIQPAPLDPSEFLPK